MNNYLILTSVFNTKDFSLFLESNWIPFIVSYFSIATATSFILIKKENPSMRIFFLRFDFIIMQSGLKNHDFEMMNHIARTVDLNLIDNTEST